MNIYFICILAMNGVDSLSLDLFSAISPDVSSPDVIVDADGDPATFPRVNWIRTSNLYLVLHLDYSRLVIYIYWTN